MGKIGILTCEMWTLERIFEKFATADYVHELPPQAKFGKKKSIYGGLVGKLAKCNFLVTFIFRLDALA